MLRIYFAELANPSIFIRVPLRHSSNSAVTRVMNALDSQLLRSYWRVRAVLYCQNIILKCGFCIWTACHRNYTSLQGRIVSTSLETCETHITVPENYTISLYFSRYYVFPSEYPYTCTDANKPLTVQYKDMRDIHVTLIKLMLLDIWWKSIVHWTLCPDHSVTILLEYFACDAEVPQNGYRRCW